MKFINSGLSTLFCICKWWHIIFEFEFENDVKMYGTQTIRNHNWSLRRFENDVKMYGTQTKTTSEMTEQEFENDVKMYGTQTNGEYKWDGTSLRMM